MKRRNKQADVAPLDGETLAALREAAGWPAQEQHRGGYRGRSRNVTIVRDRFGNVISSVEVIDEDEYEEYSETRSK